MDRDENGFDFSWMDDLAAELAESERRGKRYFNLCDRCKICVSFEEWCRLPIFPMVGLTSERFELRECPTPGCTMLRRARIPSFWSTGASHG